MHENRVWKPSFVAGKGALSGNMQVLLQHVRLPPQTEQDTGSFREYALNKNRKLQLWPLKSRQAPHWYQYILYLKFFQEKAVRWGEKYFTIPEKLFGHAVRIMQ